MASDAEKQKIMEVAKSVSGVKSVTDRMQISSDSDAQKTNNDQQPDQSNGNNLDNNDADTDTND